MGQWVPAPALNQGEAILRTMNANRSRPILAIGGKLSLTTTHLRFVPNAMDSDLGASGWDVPLTEVLAVEVGPRSFTQVFSGGLRRRLLITLRSGHREAFVINKVKDVAEHIRASL